MTGEDPYPPRRQVLIAEEGFSMDEAIEAVKRDDAGAVVAFIGTVRDDGIDSLHLETYKEAAEEELLAIREEALARFGLLEAVVIHRSGRLRIGDEIVIVACSAAHRREAFDGCRYILEELKRRASIWKKEVGPAGERWLEVGGDPAQARPGEERSHEERDGLEAG
ncbi:molybdenum cofactor biosynthesis protein MoaE [Candidatus Methanocrinis natronophilus]|uniref:Molybdenum cofactor biosynthesis protein MoaE n=1 Tax=Candidatus Methanocrinis natronophilus TaxID=3033396 RepID=A0ABT5X508_9EURY|nr:molybdenum cofactor biosynthesis protein MoaE [Candidatus Methanocrinis natronophilus]MDF0589788.1 molybdenum cofactor biosynthesis protein MoaE [Candidatus Methanocrinis natronophilus]